MNTVNILFFATLRDRAGVKSLKFDLPYGSTVAQLKDILIETLPALENLPRNSLISINQEYAFDDCIIPNEAEIAIFPPVSGGSNSMDYPTVFAITEEALDLDALLDQITLPSTGAAAIFTGMVRGVTSRDNPHQTVYLEYESYKPMAEAKMKQVADEIRTRWDTIEGIAIIQRIGRLYPRTPTVLIACTAAHRDTGVFAAARYGIDRLKEIVPVWKKEVGPDGEEWVEGDYMPKSGE